MASRGCVDLDFEAKKLGIVGLYLSAPRNALVNLYGMDLD
jgi:hypothetical protein